jgi:hypothetical protein
VNCYWVELSSRARDNKRKAGSEEPAFRHLPLIETAQLELELQRQLQRACVAGEVVLVLVELRIGRLQY